ncbi:MAG TPA: hypothetical protein VHH73_16280 [Verrucomicrobiae bacterium]|nr:hypothetical protein [Verrucomicrobiae bacterium]
MPEPKRAPSESSPALLRDNAGEFARLAQLASAVAVGGMAAFLWSLDQVVPEIKMTFGIGSVFAFLVAGGAAWSFWKNVIGVAEGKGAGRKSRIISNVALLCVSTVAAFGRSIWNVSTGQAGEVVQGVLIALAVLCAVGIVYWRVIKYLNADESQAVENPPPSPPRDSFRDR